MDGRTGVSFTNELYSVYHRCLCVCVCVCKHVQGLDGNVGLRGTLPWEGMRVWEHVHGQEVVAGLQATLARSLLEKKKILNGGAGEGEQERVILLLSWLLSVWDSLVAQQ